MSIIYDYVKVLEKKSEVNPESLPDLPEQSLPVAQQPPVKKSIHGWLNLLIGLLVLAILILSFLPKLIHIN
ncbi:MAG: hypothetical protein HQL13_04520 [Candidatus Omnitrophica bacterium]|nr:hypothetical protein [Candidatus Omnitrophota bacterium]